MKQHNRFTKRCLALFLVLCFVLSQINLPSGLIKINPDFGFLHTKAAGTTFDEKIGVWNILKEAQGSDVKTDVTFHFEVLNGTNVTVSGVSTTDINAVGSSHVIIPKKITHGGTTYTITALGKAAGASGATDAFRGCTDLCAITIPATVTEIYPNTFGGDTALAAVELAKDSNLTTIGASAFQGCFSGGQDIKVYPTYIQDICYKISLPESITSVGDNAFEGCNGLAEVKIASGAMVDIGKQAFANLGNLQSVDIPSTTKSIGVKCFYNCRRLSVFSGIPDNESFTTIPTSAFENCGQLSIAITLSEHITTLGASCFSGCNSLSSVNFSKSKVTTIPTKAFYNTGIYGSPNFNDGLTSIGESAFDSCQHLCAVEDDNGKTTLYPLQFPASLTTIGKRAFHGCTSIPSIQWVSENNAATCNIQSLGEEAFARCSNLTYFVVPQTTSLTEIPNGLLEECSAIGRIMVPINIESIGERAFNGCGNFSEYQYYDGDASKTSNYDNGTGEFFQRSKITSIGSFAFYGTNIKSFYVPSGVTEIAQGTFQNCAKLDELQLHEKITTIGKDAFNGCAALGASATKALTIPESVEIMGENVFNGCSSLKEIVFNCNQITELPQGLLSNCTSLTKATLPNRVTKLPASTFTGDKSLISVTMGGFDKLTEIGGACFKNCEEFRGFNSQTDGKIVFPSTLTSMGSSAFEGCKAITTADFGASAISSISSSLFKDSGLKYITLSTKLGSIGSDAFANLRLSSIEFKNVSKTPTISDTALHSEDGTQSYLDSNVIITVPANLLDKFKQLFESKGFTLADSHFKTTIVEASSLKIKSINPTSLIVGQKAAVEVEMVDGSEAFSLISSDESVIRIIDTTQIEAVGLGEAEISAVTASNKLSQNKITVKVQASEGAAPYVKNPITTINLTPNKTELYVGDEQEIAIDTLLGDNGDDTKEEDKITWLLSSVDNHIVTKGTNYVDNGFVRITYSQREGAKATATIKVLNYTPKAITAICSSNCKAEMLSITLLRKLDSITARKPAVSVDFSSTPIDVRGYFAFNPSSSPEPLQWSSNNTAVATVDENGQLTCVSPGKVDISVTGTKSGVGATVGFTIANDITEVKTSDGNTSYQVIAGQSLNITAQPSFKNQNMTSPDSITWTSSNTNIATINVTQSGTSYNIAVQTLAAGSTSIVGKNAAGKNLCSYSVKASPVRFERNSLNVYTAGPNKKAAIKPLGTDGKALASDIPVSYAMANSKSKKYASVSASGVISGKKKGSAKVTVTVYGVPYTINVGVTQATLNISVPGATANKKKTQYKISKKAKKITLTYNANYLGTTKKKVSYKSSKKSVATISKKGVIKLKKKGTTKITVTVNGVKKTFSLKVLK